MKNIIIKVPDDITAISVTVVAMKSIASMSVDASELNNKVICFNGISSYLEPKRGKQ